MRGFFAFSAFSMAAVLTGASAVQANEFVQDIVEPLLKKDGAKPEVYNWTLPQRAVSTGATGAMSEAADAIVVNARRIKNDNQHSAQRNNGFGVNPAQAELCGDLVVHKTPTVAIKVEACAYPAGMAAVVMAGPKVSYVPKNGLFPEIIGGNFLTSASIYVFKGKLIRERKIDLEGFVAEIGVGGLGFNIGRRFRIEPGVAYACVNALNSNDPVLHKLGVPDERTCKVAPIISLSNLHSLRM